MKLKRFWLTLSALVCLGWIARGEQPQARQTVILLHGLMDSSLVMKRLEWAFKKAGFEVFNYSYESRGHTIEEHAEKLDEAVRILADRPKLHFVGFSLG